MQIHPFSAINFQCDSAPQNIAVIDDNSAYTFAALRRNAWQAVNGFKALGLSAEDRISLVCKIATKCSHFLLQRCWVALLSSRSTVDLPIRSLSG